MKDTYLLDNYSINFNGNLLNLNTPIVMSILNTTPDSFFDGGNYNSIDKALLKVEKDLENGASIIDIGGYSSKPNGREVSKDEEIKRTIPYIESILKRFPKCNLSIDKDDKFTFFWDGSEETAVLKNVRKGESIRFKWEEDDDDETFFEMTIRIDDLTKEVALIVTDFYEDADEEEELTLLWDNNIHKLKQAIGG